jgi:hypothetical protein
LIHILEVKIVPLPAPVLNSSRWSPTLTACPTSCLHTNSPWIQRLIHIIFHSILELIHIWVVTTGPLPAHVLNNSRWNPTLTACPTSSFHTHSPWINLVMEIICVQFSNWFIFWCLKQVHSQLMFKIILAEIQHLPCAQPADFTPTPHEYKNDLKY